MIVEKGTAAHLSQQAADQTKLLKESYLNSASLSSNLKREIGELLFCLEFPVGQELCCIGWGIFEKMLRQYVDLRISGGNL